MSNFKRIPATIVPKGYIPIIAYGIEGKYIYNDNDNPYDSVIYPRRGIHYNMDYCIQSSEDSGTVPLYIDNKKQRIDLYSLIEENDREISKLEHEIEKERDRIMIERMMNNNE